MTSVAQESYLDRLRSTMEDLSTATASFKGMIYGESGVGKTVHAMMMAQDLSNGRRILYIDTAQGWVSLQNHAHLKVNTTRMRYVNLQQIEAVCHAIRMSDDGFEFGCVVLDEASTAADGALDEVVTVRASLDHTKDPDTPTQPDYNTTTNRVRKAYMDLLTLENVHVILVSHTRIDKDNTNVAISKPSFLPKLGAKVKQQLHLVTHLSGNEISEDEYLRIFQVHPTRRIDAKTRIGGLSPQVQYEELIAKTKGWLAGEVPTEAVNTLVIEQDPEHPKLVALESEE